MVIINKLTDEDWEIILSALKSEQRKNVNTYFPVRADRIAKLIQMIEEGTKTSVLNQLGD